MKKTKKSSGRGKIIGLVVVGIFIAVVAYFFISSTGKSEGIPPYVTGDVRAMYEWSKTPEGARLLEQIPCYCGCKYEGHKHARHCFWSDDGAFDKHGITCSVCLDIAVQSKAMLENGKNICEIRNAIDKFYAPNVKLATPTPMPEGCAGG